MDTNGYVRGFFKAYDGLGYYSGMIAAFLLIPSSLLWGGQMVLVPIGLFLMTALKMLKEINEKASSDITLINTLNNEVKLLIETNENIVLNMRPNSTRYQKFDDTKLQIHLEEIIKESLCADKTTNIKVLGVAMQYSYRTLRNLIHNVARENGVRGNLNLEFSVVDYDWFKSKGYCLWGDAAFVTVENMNMILDTEHLSEDDINIKVYQYKHTPNWHGVMIDGKYLFLSYCSFHAANLAGEGGQQCHEVVVGDNPYEYIENDQTPSNKDKFNIFNNWFEQCMITTDKMFYETD